jgi:hypothetical protein
MARDLMGVTTKMVAGIRAMPELTIVSYVRVPCAHTHTERPGQRHLHSHTLFTHIGASLCACTPWLMPLGRWARWRTQRARDDVFCLPVT